MTRLLGVAIALYVPHLAEEALTHMHDDPLIVTALAPLAELSARHASYLVFQVMLALTLATTLMFSLGGRARLAVMTVLGLALLAEGHHVLRALATLHYDSGLVTSLPMPLFGAYLLRHILRAPPRGSAIAITPT